MKLNHIYNKSCEDMSDLDDGSIDLIVTSPPYFNLKEYSQWDTYDDYLWWIDGVILECYRVLRPGGWVCWNVQDSIPFPPRLSAGERYSEALASDSIKMLQSAGLFYEKSIVWYKGQGTATQRLFGSYPRPGLLLVSGLTEHIILCRKHRGKYKRKITKDIETKSLLTKDEWSKWTLDLWTISPESSKRIGHPAPFPVEIPYRLIRMFSFYGDVILEPFLGSGSTALAAKKAGRNFIGYETSKKYIKIAKDRISSVVDIFGDKNDKNNF